MDQKVLSSGAARPEKISAATVRGDFNSPEAVVHYTRAAHKLGLWKSEKRIFDRFLPDKTIRLLEAGCGAGRVTLGLSELGYQNITAFDFAEELVEQARSLAEERLATNILFFVADATAIQRCPGLAKSGKFDALLFMFNGLMQIPGRDNRRAALVELNRISKKGAVFVFTTHDRDASATERALWRLEAGRWERGYQDPRLVEYGDRYFEDESGRTFMHLPDRAEILNDLKYSGWTHEFDAMRRELSTESRAVEDFSDQCRFWVARCGKKRTKKPRTR